MKYLSNTPFVQRNSNEKKRLSHSVAKTATSTFRTKWIRDTQVPGFALRIEKAGKKSWTFGYRHKPTGKYKLHTIGTFNKDDGNDTDNARALAEQMRLNLRQGIYPTNYSQGETIRDVVEYYLKGKLRRRNTGPHYWCERIILPYVGDMTLDELDTPKVWRLRNDVIKLKNGSNAAEFFVVYLKAAWNTCPKVRIHKSSQPMLFGGWSNKTSRQKYLG